MPDKPLLIASDIHLGAVPAATEAEFRRFLGHAAEVASGLLINGDLFDFWFEYQSVVLREHVRVLAALADVVDAGVPVWFVGGNHDAWGGDYLSRDIGVTVLAGPVRQTLNGWRALIAHGDALGTGDIGYRVLRKVIRSAAAVRAFRSIHPDWGRRIAALSSSTERRGEGGNPAAEGRSRHIAEWGAAQLAADPSLDLVVTGHAHIPLLREMEPNRWYANSGDWIHHFTYLELAPHPEPPKLRRWETETGRT